MYTVHTHYYSFSEIPKKVEDVNVSMISLKTFALNQIILIHKLYAIFFNKH